MKKKILLILAVYILIYKAKAQVYNSMDREKMFFYYLVIENKKPTDLIDKNGKADYIDLFGNTIDNYNYNNSIKDEFEKSSYREKIKTKILDGISKVNFNEKFSSTGYMLLGEYSFSGHFFPIKYSNFKTKDYNYCIGLGCPLTLFFNYPDEVIANKEDFTWQLNMSELDANSFIKSRKDNSGTINRTVYCKVIYSLLKNDPSMKSYFYSIEIFADAGYTKLLGKLIPSRQWDNPAEGIIINNGQQVIYYDKNFKIISDKVSASYYSIINWTDGKISNPTQDYYVSGKVQWKGNKISQGPNNIVMNGLCTWYYESGQKSAEITYTNGIRNGKYITWWENGNKKEEVTIVNGFREGCDNNWDENGNCIKGKSAWSWDGVYEDFYEKGAAKYGATDCPCQSQSIPATSNSNNNKTNNTDFIVTANLYYETDNLEQAVLTEFGTGYRIADWNDVVKYCNTNSASQFISNLDMKINEFQPGIQNDNRSFFVTNNNQHFYVNGHRHFFISRFDHKKPNSWDAFESINNDYIDLSAGFGLKFPIICVKK